MCEDEQKTKKNRHKTREAVKKQTDGIRNSDNSREKHSKQTKRTVNGQENTKKKGKAKKDGDGRGDYLKLKKII